MPLPENLPSSEVEAEYRFGHAGDNVLQTWFDLTMLAMESQQVIFLRTIKLARGGKSAHKEARLMVAEKAAAALQEWASLEGARPSSVVKRVRKKVRANARRLSR